MTDENGIPPGTLGEQTELAGYLDELIADTLARKANGRPVGNWTLDGASLDPSSKNQHPPQNSGVLEPDGVGPGSAEESLASEDETPPAGRASMSEELAALFRPTDRPKTLSPDEARPQEDVAASGDRMIATTEPSVFLRRFLQEVYRPHDLASTGIQGLDARLGGGFGPGLHLLGGPSVFERSAILDSAVWEAVISERPVIFYCLREGSMKTWERLIIALASILGSPSVSIRTLRDGGYDAVDVEALTRLDATLQRAVLSVVSLVESIPAHPDALSAFVEDMRWRAREADERHGRMPLVVLDDLERLSFLVGSRRFSRVLYRLDQVLSADSIPGIVATGLASRLTDQQESRAAQTILIMSPIPPAENEELGLASLRLLINRQTNWTGVVPLVVDHLTGLIGQYGHIPQDVEPPPD